MEENKRKKKEKEGKKLRSYWLFNNRKLCLCCVGLRLLSSQRGCRARVCIFISFKKDFLSLFTWKTCNRQQPTSPLWTKLIKGWKDIYHSNGDYRVLLETKYLKFGENNLFLAKVNGFLTNSWPKFTTPRWMQWMMLMEHFFTTVFIIIHVTSQDWSYIIYI